MRDIHSHILPCVDDGAQSLRESIAMLHAAREAGVTSIVCTPHCRDPYFDYDAMRAAFERLRSCAEGFPLQMGFEVNHRKLMELGMGWADRLHFDGSNEFLLELSSHADARRFQEYERTVFELQAKGYQVIIAHPERIAAVQRDISLARRMREWGCKLQASADFMRGGRLGGSKRPARKMLKEGLYDYLASDAHCPDHYGDLARACKKYGFAAS